MIKNEKKVFFFDIALLISIGIIFHRFILGNAYYIYTDIGSDTYHQYYPYYVNCVLKLQEGTFGWWNWNGGLGTSLLNYVHWLLDPFAILIILIGIVFGPQTIQYSLVWMQILKIIVVYVLSKKYIRFFAKNDFAVGLGAYLCAMNGFLLLWGQHYFLGTASVFILLALISIEKYVRDNGKNGIVQIVVFFSCLYMYSYYIGYKISVVTSVYFLYRIFVQMKEKTLKEKIYACVKCAGAVLLAICIAGVVLVPELYYVSTNSDRVEGFWNNIGGRMCEAFLSSFNGREISERLSRVLSNNLRFINDAYNSYYPNYYAAPMLFCTIFMFFFMGQWIVYDLKKSKCEKTWFSFGLRYILLYILLFNSAAALVFNCFVNPVHRYTFVIFPFFAICVAEVWQNVILEGKVSFIGIGIGAVFSIYAWYFSYMNASGEVHNYVLFVLGELFLGGCLLLGIRAGRSWKKVCVAAFALLILLSTTIDNYVSTNWRKFVSEDTYSLNWNQGHLDTDTAKAISWLKEYDTSFYRIEKTYEDWHYVSDSYFEDYSTVSWYNSTPNVNVYDFYTYVYYYDTPGDAEGTFKVFHADDILDICVLSVTNTKYILSNEEIKADWCELVHKIESVFIYKNMNTDSIAKWYQKGISRNEFEKLSNDQKASALCSSAVLNENISLDKMGNAEVGTFSLRGQNVLCGNISCEGDGVLMLAIPDQEGWSIYVDGQEATTFNVDYAFLGVLLDAGKHEIRAEYHVPMMKEGLILTCLGLFICLLLLVFSMIRKRGGIEND